jgi:hypothetical protein
MTRWTPSPRRLLALAALTALAGPLQAQDRADLERTRIVGSRELPKVTYIVPWKKPQATPSDGRPARSVLDDALTPLDPDVHQRLVRYHGALPRSAAPAAAR